MHADLSAEEFIACIARDPCCLSHDEAARQRNDWQRACRLWIAAHPDDQADSEARQVIQFIAGARREESSANLIWQRDDWQRRCAVKGGSNHE